MHSVFHALLVACYIADTARSVKERGGRGSTGRGGSHKRGQRAANRAGEEATNGMHAGKAGGWRASTGGHNRAQAVAVGTQPRWHTATTGCRDTPQGHGLSRERTQWHCQAASRVEAPAAPVQLRLLPPHFLLVPNPPKPIMAAISGSICSSGEAGKGDGHQSAVPLASCWPAAPALRRTPYRQRCLPAATARPSGSGPCLQPALCIPLPASAHTSSSSSSSDASCRRLPDRTASSLAAASFARASKPAAGSEEGEAGGMQGSASMHKSSCLLATRRPCGRSGQQAAWRWGTGTARLQEGPERARSRFPAPQPCVHPPSGA